MKQKGLIQLYTGDGKGKTTAACGLALRAAGRGLKVIIMQFFKAEASGEVVLIKKQIKQIEVLAVSSQKKFSWNMNSTEQKKLKIETALGLEQAMKIIRTNSCDLLILDEITYGFSQGLIDLEPFIEGLRVKPETMEIVITGRNAPTELIHAADLVTEMRKLKHPFDAGIAARIGIEK